MHIMTQYKRLPSWYCKLLILLHWLKTIMSKCYSLATITGRYINIFISDSHSFSALPAAPWLQFWHRVPQSPRRPRGSGSRRAVLHHVMRWWCGPSEALKPEGHSVWASDSWPTNEGGDDRERRKCEAGDGLDCWCCSPSSRMCVWVQKHQEEGSETNRKLTLKHKLLCMKSLTAQLRTLLRPCVSLSAVPLACSF